jgi:hypothetical protein
MHYPYYTCIATYANPSSCDSRRAVYMEMCCKCLPHSCYLPVLKQPSHTLSISISYQITLKDIFNEASVHSLRLISTLQHAMTFFRNHSGLYSHGRETPRGNTSENRYVLMSPPPPDLHKKMAIAEY